jgi:putative SOS response-associated peptidase YedK
MCGRFSLTLPSNAVADWFDVTQVKASFEPRYNICPTMAVPVAVTYEGLRHLVQMRWGFTPTWYKTLNDGPILINARAETIVEKPAFRSAVRKRRCLIPADGFYEWHREKGKGKEPWYIYPNDAKLMAFAGIWQVWIAPDGARSVTCAIVTTEAGDGLAHIHHRETVTVKQKDFGLWLGEEGKGAAALMQSVNPNFFAQHRVGLEVNSGHVDGPELRYPLS